VSNSSLITGALIFAFILFLAARNRLGAYASVLFGSASATTAPASKTATTGATPANSTSGNATSAAVAPSATQALKNAFLSVGNGVTSQQFSSALEDAAGMSAPAGVLGF